MNSELHPNDTTAAAVTNSTDLTAAEGKDDWLNDPRIAYNQQTQKWIFEDPDNGKEYEYDSELGQWIDTTNANSDGNDKEEENKDDPDAENTKKRKLQEEADLAELADQVGPDSTTASKAGSNSNSNKQKNKRAKHDQAKETDAPKKTKPNKAIYISGLPKDVSAQELDQVFSKYGIIADDLNAVSDKKDNDYTGKRIKIYRDKQTGEPKGDALIVYFKPESVQLAIEMIDGSELRAGSGELIKVQPAEFNNDNSTNKNNSGAAEKSGTAGAPALNGQKKHLLQKHYEKLNHKLADWGDDDKLAGSSSSSTANKRWEKTVILKNVFTAAELTEDPLAASEIREDIIAGCEEGAGPVSSAVLFEHDPAGVVSVKFEDREDARRCVELMNGRFFAGHRLTAEIYDGRERFQRKKKDSEDTGSTDEGKRLEEFGNWLEKEG